MTSRKLSKGKKALTSAFVILLSVIGTQTSYADYYPSGIQQNVPEQTLIDNRWTLFKSQTFKTSISADVSELIPSGKYVIFAGKERESSIITLAAAALTSAVFTQTERNSPQLLNGTYWYYTQDILFGIGSIGFAPNENIDQFQGDLFDFSDPLRMSCYTGFIGGGCARLGTFFGYSEEHLVQIWTRDADPVQAPVATLARQTTNLSLSQSLYGSDRLSDPDGQLRKTIDSINTKYGSLIK